MNTYTRICVLHACKFILYQIFIRVNSKREYKYILLLGIIVTYMMSLLIYYYGKTWLRSYITCILLIKLYILYNTLYAGILRCPLKMSTIYLYF